MLTFRIWGGGGYYISTPEIIFFFFFSGEVQSGFFVTTLLINILNRFLFVFLILGVVLISLALCADAVIGNVQEKAMKLHNGSNSEMVNTRFAILKEHVLSQTRHTMAKHET